MKKCQVTLPENGPKPSYYKSYVGYFKSIIPKDTQIIYKGKAIFNLFTFRVNSREATMDFDNFHTIKESCIESGNPYFKFQYSKKYHGRIPNIFSFTKISFYEWFQFYKLKEKINYRCQSDKIINMQRPRGASIERRNLVRDLLQKEYGKFAVTDFVNDQGIFWNTINDCLVHICVPGARNDILDRGQLQAMAFGCCTISPPISDCVAWNQELIPGIHYVACQPDYLDLIEKIEWCRKNREKCVEMGNNAKTLFAETSVPEKLWEWIWSRLNSYV